MLSKKEIKDIQSLSQKKFRDTLNLFIAEGPKMVNELMEMIPGSIQKLYATTNWINSNASPHKAIAEISETELQRISQLHTPNQVVALINQFDSREPSGFDFALYLDTIRDPGNFGTILRIADWFDVKNIVCSPGCADLYNPKVVQASMASIARVNVYYDEKEQWLQNQDLPVYAASLDGENLHAIAKSDKGILIIGNESKGIRPELLQSATKKITIPRKGKAESLNAAVATGILLAYLRG